MKRRWVYVWILSIIILICYSCSSLGMGERKLTISKILSNSDQFINKTIELEVWIGGNCTCIKRQGNICVTDGTKSLCALGNLPKEIPIRPWQKPGEGFLSLEELKKKKMWIKGVIKMIPNKQIIRKADNVIAGEVICNKEYCVVKNGSILYIKVLESHWVKDSSLSSSLKKK